MPPDRDALLTARSVYVGDSLPVRVGPVRPPQTTDGELICLAAAQILVDCQCDRWLGLLDSTAVSCAQGGTTVRRSNVAGVASDGSCAAHGRSCWGVPLYLPCTTDGIPVGYELAPANTPEREVAAELLERPAGPGQIIIADKGFVGAAFEQLVLDLDCAFRRPDH